MKTNIKLRVTPEQSKAVQKICFANNIGWFKNSKEVCNTDSPYLFIKDNGLAHCKYRSFYIDATKYTEVDADSFIRTNGTCEEFTCEHPGVNNTTGKYITCGKHIDKSDFEPNIQSSSSVNLKSECQFAKYGFEKPDFECAILTKVKNEFIGYIISQNVIIATTWYEYGSAYLGNKRSIEYDLIPIEKPWYETCKFPCIIMADDCMPVVVKHYNDGYVYDFRDNKYCVKSWRLFTNDEIEGLKQ